MKQSTLMLPTLVLFAVVSISAFAAPQGNKSLGGDVYVTGSSPSVSTNIPRDAFVAGFSPTVSATVAGDLHIVGFDVDTAGKVGQDLYAAGGSVTVATNVMQDLTVSGFTVHLTKDGSVSGNARVAAGTVTIESPITGTLLAAGGEIIVNAAVNGDVELAARDISFGPDARIVGKLAYSAPTQITIPASVISSDRVHFKEMSNGDVIGQVSDTIDETIPSVWPAFATMLIGFLISLAFFLVVGALLLTFVPNQAANLRSRIHQHAGKALLLGFLGLATLVGLVPVSLITIIGIPLIPIVILAIILAWLLGYILGVYALTMRVADAFNIMPVAPSGRLLALAIGITVLTVLNFIPFVGWIFNFAVVLLGLGAITASLIDRLKWFLPDSESRYATP